MKKEKAGQSLKRERKQGTTWCLKVKGRSRDTGHLKEPCRQSWNRFHIKMRGLGDPQMPEINLSSD